MSDLGEPERLGAGGPATAEQLLPLVYAELRRLAAARLGREKPGQTLTATELVHEAYVRLLGGDNSPNWNGQGHFFGAAAEAMRRILVDRARRRSCAKHGGDLTRQPLAPSEIAEPQAMWDLLALNDALDRLAADDRQAAELVKLRYFAGLTIPQAAEVVGISPRKADALWFFARAWLRRALDER